MYTSGEGARLIPHVVEESVAVLGQLKLLPDDTKTRGAEQRAFDGHRGLRQASNIQVNVINGVVSRFQAVQRL